MYVNMYTVPGPGWGNSNMLDACYCLKLVCQIWGYRAKYGVAWNKYVVGWNNYVVGWNNINVVGWNKYCNNCTDVQNPILVNLEAYFSQFIPYILPVGFDEDWSGAIKLDIFFTNLTYFHRTY